MTIEAGQAVDSSQEPVTCEGVPEELLVVDDPHHDASNTPAKEACHQGDDLLGECHSQYAEGGADFGLIVLKNPCDGTDPL